VHACVRSVSVALVIGVCSAWIGLVSGAHAQSDAYDETVRAALRELEEGRPREGYALFRRAHTLRPSARTERGLAIASFEAGDYVVCLEHAERALVSEELPLTDEMRAEVAAVSEQARAFVGTLRATPEVTLWVNGHRLTSPARVGLGEHHVELRGSAGEVVWRSLIVVRGGEDLELEPPSRPAERPVGVTSPVSTPATSVLAVSDSRVDGSSRGTARADRRLRALRGVTVTTSVAAVGAFAWALERRHAVSACDARPCTNEDLLRRQHTIAWVAAATLVVGTAVSSVVTIRRGRRTHRVVVGLAPSWRLDW
jgi:hypothetical protein